MKEDSLKLIDLCKRKERNAYIKFICYCLMGGIIFACTQINGEKCGVYQCLRQQATQYLDVFGTEDSTIED